MNYYPHHIGDFRSGTSHMTRLERWIYRDLIDIYYDTEKLLPLDLEKVCDKVGARTDEECKVVAYLLRSKFLKTDDGYWHERCDTEIRAYHVKGETAKANGKKSAATRYQNGEYMPNEGTLYAVRAGLDLVKVGVTANLKSRLHQLRSKYGKHVALIHQVTVAHMGNAEADLLEAYKGKRSGEEVSVSEKEECDLFLTMDRIAVAYPVASQSPTRSHTGSHTWSHTNQEPITNNHKPDSNPQFGQSPNDDVPPVDEVPAKKLHGDANDHKAARWMFEWVLKVNPTQRAPSWDAWANDVRLMREIDGRTHAEMCELFLWAKKDQFWCANIQSPAKLRKKWDVLADRRGGKVLANGVAAAPQLALASVQRSTTEEAKRLLGFTDDDDEGRTINAQQ